MTHERLTGRHLPVKEQKKSKKKHWRENEKGIRWEAGMPPRTNDTKGRILKVAQREVKDGAECLQGEPEKEQPMDQSDNSSPMAAKGKQ